MHQDDDAKVLLVDDRSENLLALQALIRQDGRQIFTSVSGEDALALMLEHEFALAILDVQMPGMNGFELAELMRGTLKTRHIPIVFVSAAGRELNYAFHGYESGAVDFLYKPLDPHAVRSKVSVFVDLFRQRLALESTQAELRRAVQMRDDFMSMVSHELRTPLNTLFLQTQVRRTMLARSDAACAPEALQRLERDERQIQSMVRLIDDMLDVTRLRTGKLTIAPHAADLAALTNRVVDNFIEQAQTAGSPITVQAPAALPGVWDEFRMEQVVTNLLTNALRYGAGKPIAVRVEALTGGPAIAVADGGMGIALDDQERIFEQFERTQGARNIAGLGLGLYITRQIVLAHGGRVEVRSAPGQGAEFTVRLPP